MLCWVCFFVLIRVSGGTHFQPHVETTSGEIRGTHANVSNVSMAIYQGIRYAQPPLGSLRFMPPQEIVESESQINATKFGPACPQLYIPPTEAKSSLHSMLFGNKYQSEDCLFLNVFGPSEASNATVMVWIIGGGFTFGTASIPHYDGRFIAAATGSIVVTFNYRLGLLGFGYLGLPEMQGNMGLLDQRMALQWVRDNIEAFGGDPQKVTLFGQDAGAASASAHVLAPKSQPMFQAAIMQSGIIFEPTALRAQGEAVAKTIEIASKLNCTGEPLSIIECLKGVNVLELAAIDPIDSSYSFPAVPVSNDSLFFGNAAETLLQNGNFSEKNFIIGTNADYSTFILALLFPKNFTFLTPWTLNHENFTYFGEKLISTEIGPNLTQLALNVYGRPEVYGSWANCLEEMVTDATQSSVARRFARSLSRSSTAVYQYLFDATSSRTSAFPAHFGAAHTTELPLVFGQPFARPGYENWEKEVSAEIMNAWTSLVRKSQPFNNTYWPSVEPTGAVSVKQFSFAGPDLLTRWKQVEMAAWDVIMNERSSNEGQ